MAARKKIEIKDTIDLMISDDYKDRFVAEYWQLRRRYESLAKMIEKHYLGKLDFEPDCPIELLHRQADLMHSYLVCLETRAKIEKIKL